MTEQLEALRKQQAEISAEILRLETEARTISTLKTGDYVKITDSMYHGDYYGRIVRLGHPTDLLPYHVKTIPYGTYVQAYEVVAVPPAEIAEFLRGDADQLT